MQPIQDATYRSAATAALRHLAKTGRLVPEGAETLRQVDHGGADQKVTVTGQPRLGDRVRVRCGATGRYLTNGLALYVSVQDNELGIDEINSDGVAPHPTLSVPTDDELRGALAGLITMNVRRESSSRRRRED
jgi:hypothetical protein